MSQLGLFQLSKLGTPHVPRQMFPNKRLILRQCLCCFCSVSFRSFVNLWVITKLMGVNSYPLLFLSLPISECFDLAIYLINFHFGSKFRGLVFWVCSFQVWFCFCFFLGGGVFLKSALPLQELYLMPLLSQNKL